MKILIVSPYLPHPKSGHGTGVFMYGLLEQISRRYSITLLSFCDKRELEFVEEVKRLPLELMIVPRGRGARQDLLWNIYLVTIRLFQLFISFIFWQPYYVSKYRHPAMAKTIRQLTTERAFDIIQFEMSQMAQYVKYVGNGKTILHEHDVSFRPAYRQFKAATSMLKRLVSYVEWCRWSRYERTMAKQFDHILCVTRQDTMLMQWMSGKNDVSYFPRGVDIPTTIPSYSSREPQSMVFIGTFSHYPNADAALWLVREIFPLVLQKFPESKLYIIGSHPPVELKSLASRMPQVSVLGFVDDVASYMYRCRVFVAPLRLGGGVKIKVLHAMAHGVPVVTTKVGMEGIEGTQSETALIGDTAQRLANSIIALLSDSQKAELLAKNAFASLYEWYSWESVVARLDTIYNEVVHD
jgi:glycosyltransferase involved in cell wall biosynthesis